MAAAGLATAGLQVSASPPAESTCPRQDIRFYKNWKFHQGDADGAETPAFPDGDWTTVSLPHAVKIEDSLSPSGPAGYNGICWYRNSFTPEPSYRGKKVFIEIQGAMQVTDLWINGTQKTTFRGGYTPFMLDITGDLKFGQTNVIALRLDSRANAEVPPGTKVPDFMYYGGLYRNVFLHVTDPLHVTDELFANVEAGGGVFVTYPSVSAASATVDVKTHVVNEYDTARTCNLTTVLSTSGGQQVGTLTTTGSLDPGASHTFTQTFTVTHPKLWHPDHPDLYRVSSQVFDGTRFADAVQTTIGIRTIKFSKANGFEINGSRYMFHGADRHMEYPFVGNAVPPSGQYRDALCMKEGGLNFVRLSHYIQPEEFVEACDKLGILTMASIPGWQFKSTNANFVANTIRDIRTMVRWYRNHPSVIAWEVLHNESYDPVDQIRSYVATAHQEYPGNQMYACGEEKISSNKSDGIVDLLINSTQHGVRDYTKSWPLAISESADCEYGCTRGTSRRGRADQDAGMWEQTRNHIETLQLDRSEPWLSGDAVWSMFDYAGYERHPYSRCGIADVYRLPKISYYFHQSQRDPSVVLPGVDSGPMVHIAKCWSPASAKVPLRVFSNCESVRLYLNGTMVAQQTPDRVMPDFAEPLPVDHLLHAPFSFITVDYQPGTLRAEGIIGGVVKATHEIRTPEAPSKMTVRIDTAGSPLLADGADLAFVYASVVDRNGTLITTATNPVRFNVTGGTIVGPNPQPAVAGIAVILVRTQTSAGAIHVTADTEGLASDSASVTSVPYVDPPCAATGTASQPQAPPTR